MKMAVSTKGFYHNFFSIIDFDDYAPNLILAGTPPQNRLGELTALSRLSS